ncbi:hypothetical protein JQ543_28325 [Bradyrhizobium diazoefficiens]|nr:hypothetical protein [Bradyrhizobium diazoefficiens]MBR0851676.1 hypothetical protein [Bradyrhizobium diazoefficiens]
MAARPIQLSDDAFRMLRKAVANQDDDIGLPLDASGIVAASELVEAEYAAVSDVRGRIELKATAVGVGYMAMIDAVLARVPDRRATGQLGSES